MAKITMVNQRVWLGGHDLSGAVNTLRVESAAEARDSAVLTDSVRAMLPGLKTVTLGHSGYFETADGLDEELHGRIGLADAPLSYAASDNVEGSVAYTLQALLAEYSPGGRVGEMLAFTGAAMAADGNGLVRGTLMHNDTRTATANGTGQQLGAVAAGQQLFGALHVTAASGTAPTLDVTVESDDNGGFTTPTTRMTFAQQVAVGYEWATPVAGPITDDWWRLVYTIGGGTPSFTFAGILGIQ